MMPESSLLGGRLATISSQVPLLDCPQESEATCSTHGLGEHPPGGLVCSLKRTRTLYIRLFISALFFPN